MRNTAALSFAAVILMGSTVLVGCQPGTPKSDTDKLSYTIGVNYGKQLKAQKVDVNAKMIAKAIDDVMHDRKLALSEDDMRGSVDKANQEIQKRSQEEASENLKKSQAFLEENKKKDGVKTTDSGLQYEVLEEGKGATPNDHNVVVVNYKGTLPDGTEFDSSYKTGKPAEFQPSQVIKGWQEGLKKMKKGGKYKLYIPPELAYGTVPRPGIPANSALVFEVELVDVKAAPKK
jgi:FKBP-type peptidyl-prolyl cis-trans isomerase FkpA/FKBP-type peptidyl-prolyl cis-trans isomerase FklB